MIIYLSCQKVKLLNYNSYLYLEKIILNLRIVQYLCESVLGLKLKVWFMVRKYIRIWSLSSPVVSRTDLNLCAAPAVCTQERTFWATVGLYLYRSQLPSTINGVALQSIILYEIQNNHVIE